MATIKAYATLVIALEPRVGEMISREVIRMQAVNRWHVTVQTVAVEVDSDDIDAPSKIFRALALDGEIPE